MKKFKELNMNEQHREKGKFKPTIPRNVPNVATASPRTSSDSAEVRLKEDSLDSTTMSSPEGNQFRGGYTPASRTFTEKPQKEPMKKYKEVKEDSDIDLKKDAPSVEAIAKKHGVSVDEIEKQLKIGMAVEAEHGKNKGSEREIAMDHLNEKPNYYTKLKKYVEETEVNEMLKPKMSALDKWRQSSTAREKMHNDIEKNRQANASQGKENMSGTITKLSKLLNKEETEQLEEGRPSQRHPLEGHDYHRKTNAELEYIAKDAHKAAEAMKSHNTTAENKYRDQANDSATVRHFRKTSGTPDWYKNKYNLKEETEMENTIEEGAVPSKEKTVALRHKSSGKEIRVTQNSIRAYRSLGYHPIREETEQLDEASTYKLGRAAAETKQFPIKQNGEHVGNLKFHVSAGKLHHRASNAIGVDYKKWFGNPDQENLINAHAAKHEAEARKHFSKKLKEETEYSCGKEQLGEEVEDLDEKARFAQFTQGDQLVFRSLSAPGAPTKRGGTGAHEYGTKPRTSTIAKKTELLKNKIRDSAGKHGPIGKLPEEVEHLNEDETLKAIAKKHDMKYHPGTYGANMSHATKGYVNINRYGEWGHYKQGRFDRGHGLATAHGDSSQHFKDLDKHLSTLKEGKFNQMDVDRQDREAAMEKDGWKKTPANVTDKSGAKHSPMSRARDLARLALNKKAKSLSPVREEKEESRKAEIVKDVVKSAKKKKSDSTKAEKFESEPVLSSEIQKQ